MSSYLFFVPTIIFLTVVLPIWLRLHYRTKGQMQKGLSEEDRQLLDDALSMAERLEDRVRTLERILDHEHRGWRDNDDSYHDRDRERRAER